jgi:peptidoglycan/xylan/chitin deacetylase (PgdA/CDA1 family)
VPRALVAAVVVLASSLLPTAVADAAGPSHVVRHGSRAEKVVALTFDDGWGRSADDRILATLVDEKVTATFFPYALAVRSNPAFWRKVAKAGFPIGNHSWSHPRFPGLTQHEMEWQIAASKRLIEKVTGVPMLRVFRPPYGAYDARVLAAAADQGFPTVLIWDATAGDSGGWHTFGSVLRGATSGTNGSIVLLHAGPSMTPDVLRAAIRTYKARGFRFVTIPGLLGPTRAPWPAPGPSAAPSATPDATLAGAAPAPAPAPLPSRPAGPPAPIELLAAPARPPAWQRSAVRDPVPS